MVPLFACTTSDETRLRVGFRRVLLATFVVAYKVAALSSASFTMNQHLQRSQIGVTVGLQTNELLLIRETKLRRLHSVPQNITLVAVLQQTQQLGDGNAADAKFRHPSYIRAR